ncbi:MAG: hypothetical protein IPN01_30090 [Deltaproteobacteria bacterium]|nr:hypothetical protein [Deltaproteobacteria bacterium]
MGGGDISFFDDDPALCARDGQPDGVVWCHVGIRYKRQLHALDSLVSRSEKLPFRLNLDKYEDDFPRSKISASYGFPR